MSVWLPLSTSLTNPGFGQVSSSANKLRSAHRAMQSALATSVPALKFAIAMHGAAFTPQLR
jgi:hypothetical protein